MTNIEKEKLERAKEILEEAEENKIQNNNHYGYHRFGNRF